MTTTDITDLRTETPPYAGRVRQWLSAVQGGHDRGAARHRLPLLSIVSWASITRQMNASEIAMSNG